MSSTIAYALLIIVSFWGHAEFTFSIGRKNSLQLKKFFVVSIFGIIVSNLIMLLVTSILSLSPFIGVAVVTASIFASGSVAPVCQDQFNLFHDVAYGITGSWTDLPISQSCDAIRRRIYNLSFNNTTELNSTVYFCRASSTKFNYSSNPTYTTGSKIRVKNVASDTPMSYITTVGLYNSNNELLAVAKLSEPLKKDPSNEITLRVRLDY